MASSVLSGAIDSHCHLQLLAEDDRQRALDRARRAGVEGFLVPALTLRDSERLLELSQREGDVWCALGCHPHEARSWVEGDQQRLIDLLREPRVVAVGECGLDFFYDRSPRDVQLKVMEMQWEIAVELGMPVIVHNRESNEVMLETLREGRFSGLGGVFHSFAGGTEMAQAVVSRGFSIGLSGMVTFKAADNVRQVIPLVPDDRLLVETDSPYLAPVPYRGQPNEPAYVLEVVERIAEESGRSARDVARSSSRAFFSVFPKAAA